MEVKDMEKRALTKDVSYSELMTMRETGMANQQIAEALGVSVGTVYRIIGKQPEGIRKPRIDQKRSYVVAQERYAKYDEQPQEDDETDLLVDDRTVRVCGMAGTVYEVSSKGKCVTMMYKDASFKMSFDEIRTIEKELNAIVKKLKSFEGEAGMEGWT